MIRGILGKIDELYVAFRNIDTVVLKNPKSYILANFGNENEIINLAIKYLNESNLDACLSYLSKIDIQLLHEKNHHLAEYWSLCFDVYHYKSTYHMHFKDYFENNHYNFKWNLTKKAINDGLIKGRYQTIQALAKVKINEDDTLDFIKFVFNKISDINELYNILCTRINLLKEFMLYGYSNGFLNFDVLLKMAKSNNEFATALVFILQNKQSSKSVSESILQNIAFKLGNEVAHVRYECGLICLQSGCLEKASVLLTKASAESQANHDSDNIIIDKLSSVDCIKSQSSQKVALSYAISHDTFIKAQQEYLINRGFFSSQSAATQKVISKASRIDITDQQRFHMLKKYSEKKSNFGRTFWSSIVCHFSHLFIEFDKNNHGVSLAAESSAKLTKSLT